MAEVGGFARPNHGLTTVVTSRSHQGSVEMSENSSGFFRVFRVFRGSIFLSSCIHSVVAFPYLTVKPV